MEGGNFEKGSFICARWGNPFRPQFLCIPLRKIAATPRLVSPRLMTLEPGSIAGGRVVFTPMAGTQDPPTTRMPARLLPRKFVR